MIFTVACHLPVRLVRTSPDPRFTAAHGAFLLIEAESYRAAGGHAGCRNELVDDISLARAVKRAGRPVLLADVTREVSMRMYHDARGVWNGYKKNIYAGVGRSKLLLAGILLLYGGMYLFPPASALFVWASGGDGLVPALIGWGLGTAVKLSVDLRNGQPFWLSFLLPASIVCLTGIALSSWRAGAGGQGYVWKGRRYS
ncbi:hypothetical protein N6H14_00955 [Paenibacillus sp. CC-CFT747]|nr:hypothetical protein N6H14_00955 [Paenibacillus sp. CC-CFT747]